MNTKEIEPLQALDNIKWGWDCDISKLEEDFNVVETAFKVLDIIKKKRIDVAALLELDNLKEYNDFCDMVGGCKILTQEEYELLKEMLK